VAYLDILDLEWTSDWCAPISDRQAKFEDSYYEIFIIESTYNYEDHLNPVKYHVKWFKKEYTSNIRDTYKRFTIKPSRINLANGTTIALAEVEEIFHGYTPYAINLNIDFRFYLSDYYTQYTQYYEFQPTTSRRLDTVVDERRQGLNKAAVYYFSIAAQMGGIYMLLFMLFGLAVLLICSHWYIKQSRQDYLKAILHSHLQSVNYIEIVKLHTHQEIGIDEIMLALLPSHKIKPYNTEMIRMVKRLKIIEGKESSIFVEISYLISKSSDIYRVNN
jgi:hypothetical protein